MNIQLVLEIVKQLLTVAGTVLVSTSALSADDTSTIVGAIMALIGVGASIYNKRERGVVKAAASLPAVSRITVGRTSKSATLDNLKVQTSK